MLIENLKDIEIKNQNKSPNNYIYSSDSTSFELFQTFNFFENCFL